MDVISTPYYGQSATELFLQFAKQKGIPVREAAFLANIQQKATLAQLVAANAKEQ